jgi:hypothetical protein
MYVSISVKKAICFKFMLYSVVVSSSYHQMADLNLSCSLC